MLSELAHLRDLACDRRVYLAQLAETRGKLCSDRLRVALRIFCLNLLTLKRELLVLGFLRQDLRLA